MSKKQTAAPRDHVLRLAPGLWRDAKGRETTDRSQAGHYTSRGARIASSKAVTRGYPKAIPEKL